MLWSTEHNFCNKLSLSNQHDKGTEDLTVTFIWGQKHLSSVISLSEPGSGPQSEKAWSFCSYFPKEAKEHGGKQVFHNASFWTKASTQPGKETGGEVRTEPGSLALCVNSLLKKSKLFIINAPHHSNTSAFTPVLMHVSFFCYLLSNASMTWLLLLSKEKNQGHTWKHSVGKRLI